MKSIYGSMTMIAAAFSGAAISVVYAFFLNQPLLFLVALVYYAAGGLLLSAKEKRES